MKGGGVGCGHSAPGSEVSPSPIQDTAAALGMWLEDRRARDTSTVARFWGPRFAGDALPGLKPWQGSPPPLLTIIPPPPPPPFFSMARPHTWFTRLLICSCWRHRSKKICSFHRHAEGFRPLVAAGGRDRQQPLTSSYRYIILRPLQDLCFSTYRSAHSRQKTTLSVS